MFYQILFINKCNYCLSWGESGVHTGSQKPNDILKCTYTAITTYFYKTK